MKNLGAVIGAALAGLFVGAASATAAHRRPKLFKNVGKGAKKMFASFAEAFKEGYYGAAEAKKRLTTGAEESER